MLVGPNSEFRNWEFRTNLRPPQPLTSPPQAIRIDPIADSIAGGLVTVSQFGFSNQLPVTNESAARSGQSRVSRLSRAAHEARRS